MVCRGDFLHRHLDAKRRRGLADDTAHHGSFQGGPGAGSDDGAGGKGDGQTGEDGSCPLGLPGSGALARGGVLVAAHESVVARLHHAVDIVAIYFCAGSGRGNE